MDQLGSIVRTLIAPDGAAGPPFVFDPQDAANTARALNSAFLIVLVGRRHPDFREARRYLERTSMSPRWDGVAEFYRLGLKRIPREIRSACLGDPQFADRLAKLSEWVSKRGKIDSFKNAAERFWNVFFPEATGILGNPEECLKALRAKRRVRITGLNSAPIGDPAAELLFTANVLMTIPPAGKSTAGLRLPSDIKKRLIRISREQQLYWYDHPVPFGLEPQKNEILHGLVGLKAAFEFERKCGNMSRGSRPVCVLSISVTHNGLHGLAKRYLAGELARAGLPKKMTVYGFTEADTRRITAEILVPGAEHYLDRKDAAGLLEVFGVDGEYGRHYSFLKAMAEFWRVFINPRIRATFKIDLDQVFPQKELVAETGASAFEHLKTPLWGARGLDSWGRPVELGMIAGALVNAGDIGKSLYTPDIPVPGLPLTYDELFFFSPLPQALSTKAEMMLRSTRRGPDGRRACSQRIHVTGGTTGILVESLRRHRPFTPSFVGRAEDQAYLLSVLMKPGPQLAYLHKDGLIMRHDKEAFAPEELESSSVGKLIGDYVRIITFSAYARALTRNVTGLKEVIDPFTGCFVSKIPTTVAYLRFGFKAASLFAAGKNARGTRFIREGSKRILKALDFASGRRSSLKRTYERERSGWDIYYDTLSAVEAAIQDRDSFALRLQKKAETIVTECAIKRGGRA
jgi:hypothetical protein